MNRVYRIIWSKALCTWVVASEFATRQGKSGGADDRKSAAQMPCAGLAPASWRIRGCTAAILVALCAPAWAADMYWDVNGTAVGLGGTGDWSTSAQFWNAGSDGVSGPMDSWDNGVAGGDNAFFMGTAGEVTLGGPITVHNLTFGTASYSLTGGTLTLTGATPTISTAAGTTTIGSVLAGSAGLTKTGGGILSLTGVNTFTGDIVISGGTLSVNGDAALGAAGNSISLASNAGLGGTGTLASSRLVTLLGGRAFLSGAGLTARYTGAGGLQVSGVIRNDANDYTGQTVFAQGTHGFTSVADLGIASSLGAPTDAASGLIVSGAGGGLGNGLVYSGDGDSSNRNWQFNNTSSGGNTFQNAGTGTLRLTGTIAAAGGSWTQMIFSAASGDMELLGQISGATGRMIHFQGVAGRTITLGNANTFDGTAAISNITVKAGALANSGANSSLGSGSNVLLTNSTLSYTGGAASMDRNLSVSGATTIRNDGTGALSLASPTQFVAGGFVDTLKLGGSFTGTNTLSGLVSGVGNLAMDGAGTWVVSGDNTFTGSTTVQNGTLVAGHTNAFGAANALVVNGGTLDLGGLDMSAASLAGTGGVVDLDTGSLTVNAASGSTTYAGNITGSGALNKLGASTLTLTGANTYTGDTTVGGGTLALDFSGAAGPASNIISSASTLNLTGGTVSITGANGEANSQTFDGLNVAAGSNTLRATSGTGTASMTVNLGAISHQGGIVNLVAPTTGAFNTTNADGALGGWATITTGATTDYAEVLGGRIVAFQDYTDQDNASLWQNGQFISDEGGAVNSAFFNTVTSSRQIAGLKYTANAQSTVTIGAGQTLGLDGTIIVNSTSSAINQTILGGSLTGAVGGGTLGVLKNSPGTFTISSDIVDNSGAVGFTVGGNGGGTGGALGAGTVSLTGTNTYTGSTTVSGATLAFNSVADGGSASAIGASSSDAANLVLENGTLRYVGATDGTDRGFTLVNGGSTRNFEVTDGLANLTFSGLVTSPDDAGFTKTGAGTLTLSNDTNDYVGATEIAQGVLSVDTLANGGEASGIGASTSASANLVLRGGTLQYTGGTVDTDRGFTLGSGGGAIDVSDGASTVTISGSAVGAGALRKQGAGTLVLSGTNAYTGGTTVDAGTLRAGSTQAFGANPGVGALAVNSGATLDLAGYNNVVGGLNDGTSGGGSVTLGSATLSINRNGNFSGAISGTGGLSVIAGTQTFTGCNNTYGGVTTISGAVLSTNCLANGLQASAIGASSNNAANLVIGPGGRLDYTGTDITVDRGFTVIGDGYVSVAGGTTLGFTGQVTGAGRFRKSGDGTLVLSGTNNYTGSTVVDRGVLRAGSTGAFGTGGVILVNTAGSTLDLAGFDNTVQYIDQGGPLGGNIQLGAATLTISNGLDATFAGTISGSGDLVKAGTRYQYLTGCSSYTGSTTISGGTLNVSCIANGGSNSSIGASGPDAGNLMLTGGTLMYSGAATSTDRLFTLGSSGGLSSAGTGPISFTNTGAIEFDNPNVAGLLTLSGANTGSNTLAAQLTNNGSGAVSLTKSGAGTWILTNQTSAYTGITRIDGGVLGVDKLSDGGVASSIGMSSPDAGNLIIGNGSTLRYTGAGDSTNRLFTLSTGVSFIESSGTGAISFSNTGAASYSGAGARTLALGGTNTGLNTMGGTIVDQNPTTGRTTLAKNDSGTWVLTGNNSYSGNTVINDGNLMIGNGGSTGNAGTGNVIVVNPTSTLSFNRSDAFNFTGVLSGAGNIAQAGPGTTVLTAANNTIGGVTDIDAGTLQIAGGSNLVTQAATIGSGTVRVDAGGSLTTPAIAMNAGSRLDVSGTVQAAGGAASTLSGDGGASTIDVNAGGTLRANGSLGDGSDVLNVAGTLDTGAARIDLGDGDDTLTLVEGAAILGAGVDAGTGGNDTLQLDHVSPLSFDAADATAFERLVKLSAGALTLTGNHRFENSVQIQGGSLTVGDDSSDSLTTSAVTMADGTVLNVDGTLQADGGTPATLSGSAGANTINVTGGASLAASGDLGDGNDVLSLAGALDTGAAVLGLGSGDDTVILYDGASLAGAGLDGGAAATNDVLILDNALGLQFDGGQAAGFEQLVKQNAGVATMTGSQSFSAGTAINGGALDVDGSLTTATVTMADGTALQVDGALQRLGGTATAITGSAGVNTVTIAGSAVASGDLGAGDDVLDVSGTLDLGGGVFALGDGDDSFVVHDGTMVNGTVDGGAGLDSRVYDITTTASLGALANFEGVTKSGSGTLNIDGPGATDLQEVEVLGGTLNIGAGASVVATAGSVLRTVVGSGATLNVDGSLGCGSGDDTLSVAGAVSGSGTINLCGGNDTLTLDDGADLSGFGGLLDGGLHSTADRIVLNNAGAINFSVGSLANFEILQKDNTGEATLGGSMAFSGGTLLNGGTLTVAGALATPTLAMVGGTMLNVDGSLQGSGGAAQISGSDGAETITIAGTAVATGDLGGGVDVLDVAGTLDTNGGVLSLGDGRDSFIVHDGSNIIGTIDGGAGLDSRVYDIELAANLGAMVNFEGLTKIGGGTLNVNGPGTTDLQDVMVLAGTLNIGAGGSIAAAAGSALQTMVGAGATLNVEGSFGCGTQADEMTVAGTVSGSGTINLCGGDDTLTLSDGAVLANAIDADAGTADTLVLDNAGALSLDAGNALNFESLVKTNAGQATLTGTSTFTAGTLLVGGALTVDGGLVTPTLAMADGTTLTIDGLMQGIGGAAATITGSSGINTVMVAAGAVLTAAGDLGAGNDMLDAAGTIDTGGGTLSLGAGDDLFNVYDTTDTRLATIDGGDGNDLLDVNVGAGNTVPLGGLLGFESLGKSGDGTLEIQGASSFIDVALDDGTLRVTDAGHVEATRTTILAGATLELQDAGSYSGTAGDDSFTVAGTIVSTGANAGSVDLGDGNDSFTIEDGANLGGLAQPVSGGAGIDTFVADLAGTATLGGAVDFETLTKTNSGTLVVAGPALSNFTTVNVDGGLLDVGVAGSLTGVQNATVANGATLNVDGVFGFTTGADSFTVAGTVTGASAIDLLDGDDTFTLGDGADLSGLSAPVDGGAGTDTFVADLAGTATLGGAINFESLRKTNGGTLIVAGPAASSFSTVEVAGGRLDIAAAGSVSGVAAGSVANGAALNVDGSYAGTAGDDSLTVAGMLTGSGSIALGDGNDTLTLDDGADLSAFTGMLDGGAHSTGDRVRLNNAGAMDLDAGILVQFEFLQKDNAGQARLTGSVDFSGGTQLNAGALVVAGSLSTPTVALGDDTVLGVEGVLQGVAGSAATITGSSGTNIVAITGAALAQGDLGQGNDVLDVAGTLNTGGGVFSLGDGDDDFVVHDGTVVTGTIDGGAGLDSRVYDIAGTAEFGALLNFEGVTKRGTGTLDISGPGATDLQSVEVEGGVLHIGAAGSVVATAGTALNTVVGSGATLSVDGSFGCGDQADSMAVAGTVSGTGSIAMCGGDDTLTLQDGAALATPIDGGADTDTVRLDTATALRLDGGAIVNFEMLQKDGAGEATLTGTASFSGGTLLNGGTLTVAGELTTPTLAMADGTLFNVTGTAQGGSPMAITGSAGVNTIQVTGSLSAIGDLGEGNDVLDVAGVLDTGTGTLALGGGDDTLTIHDGTQLIGTVVAGEGSDTFNTDIATTADLGAVQGFEVLSKTGAGTLNVNGPMSSDFNTVNVQAGTLNIAPGGSVMAQNSTVAADAILQIAGTYAGTAGDDSFVSMGTVRGALAFGAGADTARFVGGQIAGLTALDGGAGANDLLSFAGQELGDANLTAVTGWERVELLQGSALNLGTAFDLAGGVLAIDATSRLLANAGARINGNVESAGLIDAGSTRFAIAGNYAANEGALRVLVSPGNSLAGGLDIGGDVTGNTRVTFASDRSIRPDEGAMSIRVISSPNDNAATAGSFVAASGDNIVRLEGSVTPWSFGKQADNNWYLSTEAANLLPEIAGYGVLPGLGTLLSQQGGDLVHQRLANVRNSEPQCQGGGKQAARAQTEVIGDCQGVWVATTASELELGANPGFAVSGDDVGLYVGIDGEVERDNRSLRGGGYLGYTHGVYWASGENSTDLAGMGAARVGIDTPVVGLYANTQWHNGNYLDLVLSGYRPDADIRTADGFTQRITGNYLTLSARAGHRYRLENDWTLEPQLQVIASQVHWQDTVDAAGRQLTIDDDLVGTARAALRVEKGFSTAGGAVIRPWATLALQNVVGEKEDGMSVSQPGSSEPALAFPNHDLGTSASIDIGVEAALGRRISVFGVISLGRELGGSDMEQRAANLGLRARW